MRRSLVTCGSASTAECRSSCILTGNSPYVLYKRIMEQYRQSLSVPTFHGGTETKDIRKRPLSRAVVRKEQVDNKVDDTAHPRILQSAIQERQQTCEGLDMNEKCISSDTSLKAECISFR
jgi:hypothetical protein